MKGTRRYTNQTFTKRVDHEGGLHREFAGQPEPGVCLKCGAVYIDRRWTMRDVASDPAKHDHWRPANSTVCPACVQIENKIAGGYLTIDGEFFIDHKTEIGNLLSNEARKAGEKNPLARIIQRHETANRLIVETTTEHLAQRLGHALEKAYDGEVEYDFSHENKVVRVHWHRDQ